MKDNSTIKEFHLKKFTKSQLSRNTKMLPIMHYHHPNDLTNNCIQGWMQDFEGRLAQEVSVCVVSEICCHTHFIVMTPRNAHSDCQRETQLAAALVAKHTFCLVHSVWSIQVAHGWCLFVYSHFTYSYSITSNSLI